MAHPTADACMLANVLLTTALAAPALPAEPSADTRPHQCQRCDEWNQPQQPFRIHGDTYYVGTRGLSALLIDSGAGLVLLDGALPQSAPSIAASVEALGFGLGEIAWILNSHAHFDHAGGIAALQRLSGARVGASPRGAEALRRGNVPLDDPQYGLGAQAMRFPAVAEVTEIADGGQLRLGDLVLTRHATPGHTPGGSTWSWRSCEDGECFTVVYADSLTAVSSDGFRYTEDRDGVDREAEFRASIARVRGLDCGVLVSTHPEASMLFERLAMVSDLPDANAFVDKDACRAYADRYAEWLDRRLAKERSAP